MITAERLHQWRVAEQPYSDTLVVRRSQAPAEASGNPHTERRASVPPEAVSAAGTIDAPPGMDNLPLSMTETFVGRTGDVAGIRRALAFGEGIITQPQTLHGLGGVGKTSLALRYAREHRSDYTLVWWIVAQTCEQVDAALADLAVFLHPSWALGALPDQQTEWAILWLQSHDGWLLVFDNAESPADLNPYLGRLHGHGHQLVTSRRADGWRPSAQPLRIDVLAAGPSVSLLCRLAMPRREPTGDEIREAEALATELGHLPLALAQAGAYLRQTGMSFATYRALLAQTPTAVLDAAGAGHDADRTIARIWRTTLRTLERSAPLAARLLHTLAWYAPEAVPRAALSVPKETEPAAIGPSAIDGALSLLAGYNLITLTDQDITVHRLVQTTLRSPLLSGPTHESDRSLLETGRDWAEAALLRSVPDGPRTERTVQARWQEILPHIQALAANRPTGRRPRESTVQLYERAARELIERDQKMLSVTLMEAVVDGLTQLRGPDARATLDSRDTLADVQSADGDPQKAVLLCRGLIADRVRLFGLDDPATLASRHTYAYALRKAGDHQTAVREFEAVVADRTRVLGREHTDTLDSRDGLAYARQMAGDHRRAVMDYEAVVEDRTAFFGADHTSTLDSRNSLAYACSDAGDHPRAILLYKEAITDRARVLGADHPDTLTSRGWLAHAQRGAKDYRSAIADLESIAADRTRLLGADHPDTIGTRADLAVTRQRAGAAGRAVRELEGVVADRTRVQGPDHPATLDDRRKLASAYRAPLAGGVGGPRTGAGRGSLRYLALPQRAGLLPAEGGAPWGGGAGDGGPGRGPHADPGRRSPGDTGEPRESRLCVPGRR